MIKDILEKKFFPYVIKPGRYAGGEPGSIYKTHDNRTSYLHAFPDKYEIGHSYFGLQTIYHVVNKDDRFVCERTFAVDNDAEEILRNENLPLFSLETFRPIKEFDAVGFTLSYELVFTNLLNMLDMGQMPLHAKERDDSFPIIMAGGPAVYNPEPIADFVDLFFIGDGEVGLIEILEIIHNNKDKSKQEKLTEIVKNVQSVYVPAFYDENLKPLYDFVPEYVSGRIEAELKNEYYPDQPLVPLVETVHSHLSVEIMRGCPQGCRFCQAGPIYRPVRMRPVEEIVKLVNTQMKHSGSDEITLLSLSSSDYTDIDKLASTLARTYEKERVSINLPSLRPGTISAKLLNAIKKVRKGGLTISPEAGTERLRQFIRKDFPDEAIFDTALLAFEKGWTTLKLYFMVGLPTETDKDLDGIIQIVQKIHDLGKKFPGRKTINVTLSPFVPKAHTPFQWDEMVDPEEILRRIHYVKRNCRVNTAHFKYPTVEASLLQAIIGRGGRKTGNVIEQVFNKGGRFDGWNENFDYNQWLSVFNEMEISVTEALRAIPFSQPLPWSHIRKGVTVEHLQKERQRTSTQLKEYTIKVREDDASDDISSSMEYGRARKKIVSQQNIAPTKNKVRFRLGKGSRYKYIGHLDTVRFIERIIRMAKLPVLYSQGFNPSMKLSFGPPLSLGFTSESEYVDITFDTTFMPYMAETFKKALPEGIELLDARIILTKAKAISSLVNRVVYTIDSKLFDDIPFIEKSIADIMALESLEMERVKKESTITIDIRPAIYELSLQNDKLLLTLGIGEGGYARPNEVMRAILGERFDEYILNFMHRREMYRIDKDGQKIEAMDL